MQLILQLWGGLFYLFNKIFFSLAEGAEDKEVERRWRKRAWQIYLAGIIPWVVIFVSNRNWMAASVEVGGAFSMILGLMMTREEEKEPPKWLDAVALISAILGISYSLYDFGGFHEVKQWLELVVVVGFLVGTYLLAKEKPLGYLFLLFMNGANAALMGIQGYPWLLIQQIVSAGFVIYAMILQRRKARRKKQEPASD